MRLITETTEILTVTMQELQQEMNEKLPPDKAELLWRTGYAECIRTGKIIKWRLIMEEKGAK